MSGTKKGMAYEKFVQGLYQSLHDAEGFEQVCVEHNKTDLAGRSGCQHQLDVYWEFRVAQQTFRTAIECKAFDKPVSIGRVRDFYGVLADISGLQGILVSLCGFHSGAKKFAEFYGISLKEVRVPTDEDWRSRLKDVHLRFDVVVPEITAIVPAPTKQYRATLMPGERVETEFAGTTHEAFIVDENGGHVSSIEELRQALRISTQPGTGMEQWMPFHGRFLKTSSRQLIPIDGVTVRYDVNVDVQQAELFGEHAAKAIIKDVKTGNVLFFDRDGEIRSVRA